MATVDKIKIIVEAEDKATAPISNATEATKKLGKESKKVSKESKKDWGGLGDLFSQVLPRSLQKLSRGFKGTQRQVGRLSKGFKALKSAWSAIGIGVVIMALEEVIGNWQKYSDLLGITSEAGRKQADVEKKQTEQLARTTAELEVYKKTATNVNALELDRLAAVEELSKTLPRLANIDLDAEGSLEKINKAYQDLIDKDNLLIANESDKAEVMQSVEDALKARVVLTDVEREYSRDQVKLGRGKQALEYEDKILKQRAIDVELEFEKEKTKLQERQQGRLTEINLINKRISDELGNQADAAQAVKDAEQAALQTKREAEAERKRILQQQAADAKWLANQRITIAQQTELRLIQDEEQRELRSLEIQHEAAKEELALRGGTLLDKLALEQSYLMDKEAIENDYKDRAAEQTALDDQKAKDDAATLKAALATDQENEILAVQNKYAKLQELAVADSDESKKLTEKSRLEIEAINKKFDDKEIAENQKVQALKLAATNKMVNSVSGLLGNLSDLAEGNSEQQKKLAVVDILINQAVAMANAVAGAAKASKEGGPAAPFLFAAYVATMLGTIAGTFASIKGIMNEAGASGGGSIGGGSRGGGGGGAVQTTLPLPARLDSPSNLNQAYVVQSQLQGQQMSQNRLNNQIIL
tara:strand:+ start:13025 stop:14962 length:1938 start_codon:yes stop_codon:yes gene_type:complete